MTDQTPPPGSYDWLVKDQTVEIPLPGIGPQATLRVEITARARIYPTRGWAVAIIVWGLLVLLLLARAGHAATWADQDAQRRAPAWGSWDSPRAAPAWGAQAPGQTTTYHPYQRQDGTVGRCAVSQWRGEPTMRCE
jgi:hypothetical protein